MGEVSALHRQTHPGGRWLRRREAQRAGVGRQEGPFNLLEGTVFLSITSLHC